jgi:hypothetical protein
VFVSADSKERPYVSVIELTVPIEAEATASPMVIATSELAPGMPAGLQLSASAQSELTSPVQIDVLVRHLPYPDCREGSAFPLDGKMANDGGPFCTRRRLGGGVRSGRRRGKFKGNRRHVGAKLSAKEIARLQRLASHIRLRVRVRH